MGADTEDEITDACKAMLADAKHNGMSPVGLQEAEQLFHTFRDIFRIRLGDDPPVKIPPLEVKLKRGATPVKDTQ